MKLSSIKNLVLCDIQFIKELYVLIFQESILKELDISILKNYYNTCIKIQRVILYYEYGNNSQVSHYILNLIRNNINTIYMSLNGNIEISVSKDSNVTPIEQIKQIEQIEQETPIEQIEQETPIEQIKQEIQITPLEQIEQIEQEIKKIKEINTKDDLFEVLICKFLGVKLQYQINIEDYIYEIKETNRILINQLKINIENLKTSITKNSILHTVELIDSLYRPDLEQVCKQFTVNLFYIYETESFEDLTFDFESLETDITDYVNLQFQFLLEQESDFEILHHSIFKTTNFMEYFINLISELNEYPDNNDKRKDLSKVLSSLLKLSKIVTQINNSFLTSIFQEHFKEVKKLL